MSEETKAQMTVLKPEESAPDQKIPTKQDLANAKHQHRMFMNKLKEMTDDLEIECRFMELRIRKFELEQEASEKLPEFKQIVNEDQK